MAVVPPFEGALREPGVSLNLPCGEIGDCCPVHHPPHQAVPVHRARRHAAPAVAPARLLALLVRCHLGVVLVKGLAHAGHGAVGYLHRAAVEDAVQQVLRREAGVEDAQELSADVGGNGPGVGWIEPGDPAPPPPAPWCRGRGRRVDQLVVVPALPQRLQVRGRRRLVTVECMTNISSVTKF